MPILELTSLFFPYTSAKSFFAAATSDSAAALSGGLFEIEFGAKMIYEGFTKWWFQIFLIFTPTWGNDPIWLIFFRWVETTNWFSFFLVDACRHVRSLNKIRWKADILLMEKNPAPPIIYETFKKWDILHINWCRISSINSIMTWSVIGCCFWYSMVGPHKET